MAGPIAMAAAMSRIVKIRCPHCGKEKAVERRPREFRVCPRCGKHFPDPIAASPRRKR